MIAAINAHYSFHDLIKRFTGQRMITDTLLCPFHEDTRKSAKIYRDPDGERLHCFTETKQYKIVDYLLLMGEKLEAWYPGPKEEIKVVERKIDFNTLDVFKDGECDIKEFFNRMLKLKEIE